MTRRITAALALLACVGVAGAQQSRTVPIETTELTLDEALEAARTAVES